MLAFRANMERRGIQAASPFGLADFLQGLGPLLARQIEDLSADSETEETGEGTDLEEGREATPPPLVGYSPSPSSETSVELLEEVESTQQIDLSSQDRESDLEDPTLLPVPGPEEWVNLDVLPTEESFLVPPPPSIVLGSSQEEEEEEEEVEEGVVELSFEDPPEEESGLQEGGDQPPGHSSPDFGSGEFSPILSLGRSGGEEDQEDSKGESGSGPVPVLLVRPVRPGAPIALPGGREDFVLILRSKNYIIFNYLIFL
jgi:hypothetical protein